MGNTFPSVVFGTFGKSYLITPFSLTGVNWINDTELSFFDIQADSGSRTALSIRQRMRSQRLLLQPLTRLMELQPPWLVCKPIAITSDWGSTSSFGD